MSLPIIQSVDLLVLGGSSAAVAAALAAHQAGVSVLLLAPRPYLGEDVCAFGRFWQEAGSGALARRCFEADGPPRPMQVKLGLEQSLVEAGVSFVLNVQPAGLLKDAQGRVGGAIVANRAGRQGVRARVVIDAGIDHQASRLGGADLPALRSGVVDAELLTLGGEDSAEDQTAFAYAIGDKEFRISARRHRLSVDLGDGAWADQARAYGAAVDRVWQPGLQQLGERLDFGYDDPALSGEILPGLHVLALGSFADNESRGAALGSALASVLPVQPEGLSPFCVGESLAAGSLRHGQDGLRPVDSIDEHLPGPNTLPVIGRWDVVVVGGGTGGAPAAIAAGRHGASCLVIEQMPSLGGVGTVGQIACYWYGNRIGFTAEIDQGVAGMEAEEKFQKGKGAWHPLTKAMWLHQQQRAAGVDTFFATACAGVVTTTEAVRERVSGLIVAGPYGYGLVEVGAVVDATGNADVAAAAGAPCTSVDGEHVAVQGTGLAGVRFDKPYNNSDHSFSDDCDLVDATRFLVESKLKFADHFDGGQLVDSRERRQIIGEAVLSPVDFLYGRRFPDTICHSSSNFDSHGFTIHPLFLVLPPGKDRLWVDVPFRALLPQQVANVLVTGLGLSVHRDALPVVRMQPDVQNHGYAAGRAAAMAATQACDLRDIDLADLQQHLIDIGNLEERVLKDSDSFPLSDADLNEAIGAGLADHRGISACFAEAERSLPLLRARFDSEADPAMKCRCAQILALLDDAHGIEELRRVLADSDWDEGWNYTGMGQFGFSMSPIDGLLVALTRIGDAGDWALIQRLADSLGADPAFSHCRALALACERLHQRVPDARAAAILSNALAGTDISGHALVDQVAVQAVLSDDSNETRQRNLALREIYLARGLWRCGDLQGQARAVLIAYGGDLRGHFARHALALLSEGPGPIVRSASKDFAAIG